MVVRSLRWWSRQLKVRLGVLKRAVESGALRTVDGSRCTEAQIRAWQGAAC